MQFLEVGVFLIELSEIVCIYSDEFDVHLILKHPIKAYYGKTTNNLTLTKTHPESERLLTWAKRRRLTLDE